MSITAECNVCGKKYEAPDSLAGKRVRCKQCGNIFELAGGEGGPDLDALAEMERSHHSLDATAAGQQPDSDDSGDADGESPKPLRTGRTNVRFAFPLAKEIDTWAPLVLTLGGLAWLASFVFHYDSSSAGESNAPTPHWLQGIWFGVAMLSYWVIICPISLSLLRSAGRSVGYQMPVNDGRRAFAAFLPPFVLAYVLWATGDGHLMPVILGCIAAIAVASATVWLLFRLRTHEIAPTLLYTSIGLVIGILIAGGVFYGLNILTANALVASKKPDIVVASPFGPGFGWISQQEIDRIHAELAAARPSTAPTISKPEPTGPTPPPLPTSPIVQSSQIAPLNGGFEDVVRPLVDSHSLAVVRRGSENNSITIEVYNVDTWKSQGSSVFDTRSEVGKRRILSPDGKLIARIVSFPSLSIQVSSFADSRVNNVYFGSEDLGTPELVGFLSETNLLVLWQKPQSPSAMEIINISTRSRVSVIKEIPAFNLGESTLAVSNDGSIAAVAAKVNNVPSILLYNLQSGDNKLASERITSLDPRWPVSPTGFAFSPDKKQIAILFEQSGAALLQRYELAADRMSMSLRLEQVYPAGPIRGGTPRQYSGSAIAWLPDSNGWLIYGQAAFSAASGQSFAELGAGDVWSARVLTPNLVQLISSGGSKQLTVLQLDTAKIATMVK